MFIDYPPAPKHILAVAYENVCRAVRGLRSRLGVSALRARIKQWLALWGYYAKIISIGMAGLAVMTPWGWMQRGFVLPQGPMHYASILPHPVSLIISAPFAFALLVYALQREEKFDRVFSVPCLIVSIDGFIGAMMMDMNVHWWAMFLLALIGTITSFFIFVPWVEFFRRARREWQLSLVALAAASLSYLYFFTDYYLFNHLCQSTAKLLYWLLHGLGIEMGFTFGDSQKSAVVLFSKYYKLRIYRPCSGVEGIFLFEFLLSAIFLIDWPLFRRKNLLELYMLGFIYMFFVNCLRIASIFYMGDTVWQPTASPFAKSLREAPMEMLHSAAGEIYYFIAFVAFAAVLYRFGGRAANDLPLQPAAERASP